MIIFITGANGQLSKELIRQLGNKHTIYAFSRHELDITDLSKVEALMSVIQPDFVIHAAAISSIDDAEADPQKAYLVNTYGTRNVAVAAEKVGAGLVYVSSAYVFDGSKEEHCESDLPRPLNIYGESKLGGEFFVKSFHSRYWILRTSWLYGENFIRSIIDIVMKKQLLRVSPKQLGTPSSTTDLAEFILRLIQTEAYGVYHVTNSGKCNKYEYYKRILELLEIDDIDSQLVAGESHSPVPRPQSCALNQQSLIENGFEALRPWDEALAHFIHTSALFTNDLRV